MIKYLNNSKSPAMVSLQRQTTKVLAFMLWAHLPIVLALGWLIGSVSLIPSLVLSGGLAAVATFSALTKPDASSTRCLVASCYVLQAAAFVLLCSGHAWQIDMHMYFYAALAISVATFDSRAILAAAAVTAVHHLALNFVAPAWVFPGGADFARVILHAAIVILQTLALLTLMYKLHEAISTADEKSKELMKAQDILEQENLEREKMVEQLSEALASADEKSKELLEAQAIVEQESLEREKMVEQLSEALASADEKSQELLKAQKVVEQESLEREKMVEQLSAALASADEKSAELLKTQAVVEQESREREKMVESLTKAQQTLEQDSLQRQDMVRRLANALAGLASGNLTTRLQTEFSSDFEKLRTDFNTSLEALERVISEVIEQIANIDMNAEEISKASSTLSSRTENQAASLEETAAALDEITVTVETTAKGSKEANELVASTQERALKSGEVVRDAVKAMGEIESSSSEIAKVVSLIDDIAFQTNLLALNAGVEAARAGDAGKGFAVVANEVRTLAQRSSDAAQEIKSIIAESLKHVAKGVQLVGQTGTELDGIVEQVTSCSSLVSNISVATDEQATALSEVNSAINQMNQLTQHNAAMAEETTAACYSLSSAAGQLHNIVEHFKIEEKAKSMSGPDQKDLRRTA